MTLWNFREQPWYTNPNPHLASVFVTGPYTDIFGFLYVSEPDGCWVTSCSESQAKKVGPMEPWMESLVDWFISWDLPSGYD